MVNGLSKSPWLALGPHLRWVRLWVTILSPDGWIGALPAVLELGQGQKETSI